MLFDWGLAHIINYNKKKQLKRDEELFEFKIEQILQNSNISEQEKIEKAKELCRDTEGKLSTGAYMVLYNLKNK